MGRKIIVIGAGIIGASIAYHLSREEAEVTVIEKAHPASGATSKSFAWINSSTAETHDYYRLRAAGIAAYHTLEEELGDEDFTVRWSGSLEWSLGKDTLPPQIDELREYGCDIQLLDRAEFETLESHVNPTGTRYIHAREEGAIDAVSATHALLRAAAARRATLLYGCEVEDFILTGTGVSGITTTLESIWRMILWSPPVNGHKDCW